MRKKQKKMLVTKAIATLWRGKAALRFINHCLTMLERNEQFDISLLQPQPVTSSIIKEA